MEAALGGGHRTSNESHHAVIDGSTQECRAPGVSFQLTEAAHPPEALGKFIDQDLFGGISGLMLAAEAGAELIKFGRVFARQDQLLRVEAVSPWSLRLAERRGLIPEFCAERAFPVDVEGPVEC